MSLICSRNKVEASPEPSETPALIGYRRVSTATEMLGFAKKPAK